jgi:hypothetical protein
MRGPFWNEKTGVTGERDQDPRLMGLFPDGTRLVSIQEKFTGGETEDV